MTSRREKVRALLKSPHEGERSAAKAALERISEVRPRTGTPEWFEARQKWCEDIEWAVARLGSPVLTPDEARTLRNVGRNRGNPWDQGADAFRSIHRKLKNAEPGEAAA